MKDGKHVGFTLVRYTNICGDGKEDWRVIRYVAYGEYTSVEYVASAQVVSAYPNRVQMGTRST